MANHETTPPETDPQEPLDLNEVADSIQGTLFSIWGDFIAHLPFLAVGVALLLISWLIASLFERFSRKLLRRWRQRQSLKDLVTRLVTISIWVVGVMLAAMVVFPGLTPARALGAMGLMSIAVGFAFKDIFENFFAGILILWRFPFEKGDFIECEGITGKVENVTVRMSMIRKTSGELVVVPNSFLFKNPVEVLTAQDKRRVTIIAGVAYGEDVGDSVEVITKAVRACKTVAAERPVQIFPQAFGASSIDIEVTWWTDPKPVDIRRSRGEVVQAVKRSLDEAGIEIPFPYRTLTFKEPLTMKTDPEGDASNRQN